MRKDRVICNEDFQDFSIGEFPFDPEHTATGEYHHIVEEGYFGNWVDQVCNYTYNGTGPSWIITELDGVHFMESMRIEKNRPHRMFPTLETGDRLWRNYEASVKVQRLSQKGMAGLAFCMNNSIDTLVFALRDRNRAELSYRHKEELHLLAECEFIHDCDTLYRLRVDCNGGRVDCYVDDRLLLWANSPVAERGGKLGITADCPTRFTDVAAAISGEEAEALCRRREEKKRQEMTEMSCHPRMKLWKKIDLRDFGTSRQIRFGHLTGTEQWYVVLAQMQKRVSRDAYGFISCLTAIDLDGNILWQQGEPSGNSRRLGRVSADMPLQVYDIDGDGADEIIVGQNFEIDRKSVV